MDLEDWYWFNQEITVVENRRSLASSWIPHPLLQRFGCRPAGQKRCRHPLYCEDLWTSPRQHVRSEIRFPNFFLWSFPNGGYHHLSPSPKFVLPNIGTFRNRPDATRKRMKCSRVGNWKEAPPCSCQILKHNQDWAKLAAKSLQSSQQLLSNTIFVKQTI